ncbi:MAG: hypothetical protein IJJ82_05670 [Clostridia bacterium]|nr:hypothetical protein [Clostridia bacterium]
MKRTVCIVLVVLLLIAGLFILTGCLNNLNESDSKRLEGLLYEKGILLKTDEFIETYTDTQYAFVSKMPTTYYIYKRSTGEYIAVYYGKASDKNKECKYEVSIHYDVEPNQAYTPVEDNKVIENYDGRKYLLNGKVENYCVIDHSFLFFHDYDFTLEK